MHLPLWTLPLHLPLSDSQLQNCRSLIKHLPFFQSFVYASTYKIIGLSETWLSISVLDSEILPHGYTIYRRDRESCGGGVMLAVSHNFPSNQLPNPPNLEVVTVSVSLAITCCMVYAPPSATAEYHMQNSSTVYKPLLLYPIKS